MRRKELTRKVQPVGSMADMSRLKKEARSKS